MSKIMEIVRFRTTGTREDFVIANGEIENWVLGQSGFVSRQLVSEGERGWIDMVIWDSLAEAETAAVQFGKDLAECAAVKLIEGESVTIVHAPLVSSSVKSSDSDHEQEPATI